MPTTADVLASSTAAAQKAAQMIGGTFTQGVGFKPNPTSTATGNVINQPDTPQGATPQTVISGANISDNVNPQNAQRAQQITTASPVTNQKQESLSEMQARVANQGKPGYDVFGNPGAGVQKDNTNPSESTAGTTIPGTTLTSTGDTSVDNTLSQMDTLQKQMDATSAASISLIKSQYQDLINKQQDANTRQQASINQSLLMGGSSRYAQISSAGVVNTQVSYGINQISDLQNKENAAVLAIQQAQQANKMKMLDMQLNIYDKVRQEKIAATQKLNDVLAKQTEEANAQQAQAKKDQAIIDIFQSGITDPGKVFEELKKNGDTTTTAKDVTNTLALIAKNTGAGSDLTKAQNALEAFAQLSNIPGGLPKDILALPSKAEQLFAFMKQYNTSSATGTAAGKPAPVAKVASTATHGGISGTVVPGKNYNTLDMRRYSMTANATIKNYIALPGYSLTANGQAYLSKIESAGTVTGSVPDQELLDAVTKLDNAGGQVTEAQVNVVLKGKSFSDWANIMKNKIVSSGGVLSDDQRKQLMEVAKATYKGYQKMYQPIYDEATAKLKDQGIPEAFWNIPDLNKLSARVGSVDTKQEASSSVTDYVNTPPPTTTNYDPNVWGKAK